MRLTIAFTLLLAAAPLRAETTAAPAGQAELLKEIDAWRVRLPQGDPPSPITLEFQPRLDAIVARVKAAKAPEDLNGPRKDLHAWQHDLVLKDYKRWKSMGFDAGSLNDYSARERGLISSFAHQRERIIAPAVRGAAVARTDANGFYDGGPDGQDGGVPGSAGAGTRGSVVNAQALSYRVDGGAPPPVTSSPLSLSRLGAYLDRSGISDGVIRAVQGLKNEVAGFGRMLTGFAGSCYYGAKWLLIKAHVLPAQVETPEEIGRIGIGSGSAYMMAAALNKNPKLLAELNMRRLDLSKLKPGEASLIPERSVFVYSRGCAGFSDDHGHIEVVLAPDKMSELSASAFYRVGRGGPKYKPSVTGDDALACSDGCAVRSTAFLRTYGRSCLSAYVPVAKTPR